MYQQPTIDDPRWQNPANEPEDESATHAVASSWQRNPQGQAGEAPTEPLGDHSPVARNASPSPAPYIPDPRPVAPRYYSPLPDGAALPPMQGQVPLQQGQQQGVWAHQRVAYQRAQRWNMTLGRIMEYLWFALAVLEVLLALRFFLRVLGANAYNAFVQTILGVTNPMIAPFATAFANPSSHGHVLEVTTLLAIVIYGLIGIAAIRLVWLALYRDPSRKQG
jgi:YggT family protein